MKVVTVRATAKVFEDETGAITHIPVLLTEHGDIVHWLLHYVLMLKRNGKSLSSFNTVVTATQKLLDYTVANQLTTENATDVLALFASRLRSGTVDEDGFDKSYLYWQPISRQTAHQYIYVLTQLTDWVAEQQSGQPINSKVPSDTWTKRLQFIAWYRKNQQDFLGHIKRQNSPQLMRQIRGPRPLNTSFSEAITFPDNHFESFYLEGIGGAKDPRVALRDKLILLLIHGGGLRESEALHLWVNDVFYDPLNEGSVLVRIYHPEEGQAPDNWRSRLGARHRAAYLKEKYALAPRTQQMGSQHLGWKGTAFDGNGYYINVQWFPREYGIVFAKLWQNYLKLLVGIERYHPYTFINFKKRCIGEPYTKNAFHYNYRLGLKRIDLKPSKANGLSPHGHRHSYGRRLWRAGVPDVVIKKCLHHASLSSQQVYTVPTAQEISDCLTDATARLNNDKSSPSYAELAPSWQALIASEFDSDINPYYR